MSDLTDPPVSCPQPSPYQATVLDVSKVRATYVNFCRVTGTPEEVVIDFGFVADAQRDTQVPILAPERISLSLYTATRLLESLRLTLEHHEAMFGLVEDDLTKRLDRQRA